MAQKNASIESLAVERTHLANERTYMAYFRTSLAFFVTGTVVLHLNPIPRSFIISVLLMVIGVLLLIFGTKRFLYYRSKINKV